MRRLGIIRLTLEELDARLLKKTSSSLKRNSSSRLPPRLRDLNYNAQYDLFELLLEGSPLLEVRPEEPIPLVDADEYLA